jgi:hypothetical protein
VVGSEKTKFVADSEALVIFNSGRARRSKPFAVSFGTKVTPLGSVGRE